MTLPSTRSSDPPPPLNAVRQLLNSLRTSGQTWVALLALLLAYGTYRRAGSSSGLGFGDKLAGKTLEERKDPLGSGGVEEFPPLDELDDRGRLWPPDVDSPICTPKIYVYDLPDELRLPESTVSQCRWSAYNSELLLYDLLIKPASSPSSVWHPRSDLYTSNPNEADFFFIPLFPSCYLFDCWVKAGWTKTERCGVDRQYIQPVMDHIKQTLPHWNASGGSDHLIVHSMDFIDGYYTEESRSVMNASIYLVTVGDLRPSPYGKHFRFYQDLVIPSSTHLLNSYYINPMDYLDDTGRPLLRPRGAANRDRKIPANPTSPEIFIPTPEETGSRATLRRILRFVAQRPPIDAPDYRGRTTLAIFRGGVGNAGEGDRYSLSIRSLFFPCSGNISLPPYSRHSHPGFSSLPDFDVAEWSENDEYAQRLARSKFGLAPPGYTLDTTRIYEYLAFGVVPVFIGTGPRAGQVLPFETDVDWSTFTVFIPRERAHEVPRILRGVGEEEYEKLRRNVWEVGRNVVLEGRKGNVWKLLAKQFCRKKRLGLIAGSEIANN